MLTFIARRVGSSLVVLWAMATAVYTLAVYLMPGDTPFWDRYLPWMGALLRGHMTSARSGASVWPLVGRVLPWTLLLLLVGVEKETAVAAALVDRSISYWSIVALGVPLFLARRRI